VPVEFGKVEAPDKRKRRKRRERRDDVEEKFDRDSDFGRWAMERNKWKRLEDSAGSCARTFTRLIRFRQMAG